MAGTGSSHDSLSVKRGLQIPIVSVIPGFLYRAGPSFKKVDNDIHGIILYPAVDSEIGPLQLVIHVVQNRRAEEQTSPWDKTEENYHLKLCLSFVCLVPVQLLLSSVAVWYHVNG